MLVQTKIDPYHYVAASRVTTPRAQQCFKKTPLLRDGDSNEDVQQRSATCKTSHVASSWHLVQKLSIW